LNHQAAGVCSWSGKPYCREELVDIDGKLVARDNVGKFMQDLREQVARARPNSPVIINANPPTAPGFFAQLSKRTKVIAGVFAVLIAGIQTVWKDLPVSVQNRLPVALTAQLGEGRKEQQSVQASATALPDAPSLSLASEKVPQSTGSGEARSSAVSDVLPALAASDSGSPRPTAEPDTSFTVAALVSAFESDRVAATRLFKAKPVTVRDVVERFGKHDVSLRNIANKDRSSVKCKFDREYEEPAIQVGSTITIQGTLDKRGISGTIGLNQCAVLATEQR